MLFNQKIRLIIL